MPPRTTPDIGRNLVNQRGSAAGANSGVVYPDEIRCYVCHKTKPLDQYAQRQLVKWRSSIYQPYAPGGRTKTDPKATCKSCTPNQTTELTCCICHKSKELKKFAKSQRKTPDHAKCMRCVEFHLTAEPGVSPPSSDHYSDTDDEDGGDFDDDSASKSKPKAPSRVAPPRNVTPDAGRNVSQRSTSAASEEEGWETVSHAGSTKDKYGTPWGRGSTTASPNTYANSHAVSGSGYRGSAASGSKVPTKKGGWAKVEKVPKGKEGKWGNLEERDEEFAEYGRNIQASKMIHAPKVKKKPDFNVVEHEDDEDDTD